MILVLGEFEAPGGVGFLMEIPGGVGCLPGRGGEGGEGPGGYPLEWRGGYEFFLFGTEIPTMLLKLRSPDTSCPCFPSDIAFGDKGLKCSKCYDRKAKIAFKNLRMLQSLREETKVFPPRPGKNSLDSVFKEVRVFREASADLRLRGLSCETFHIARYFLR